MTNTPDTQLPEQPAGQTVAQILDHLFCDGFAAGRIAEREQTGIRTVYPKYDDAETAITAHIVELLEGLKEKSFTQSTTDDDMVDESYYCIEMSDYDAAIAKYKGERSE